MNAKNISTHENSFFTYKKDSNGKAFVLSEEVIPIKDSGEFMHYTLCRRENNDNSFYYEEKIPKTQIVLHYTAGYLKGDVAVLTSPGNHVSVPFILPRNGKILNMWHSGYWSYHLGPGAVGGNTAGSKRTIGIEISNIGYLNRIGNKLVSIYSNSDVYCTLDERGAYQVLDNEYRLERYYASFTNKQYDSLIVLLRYLTGRYNIPRTFLPESERYVTGDAGSLPGFKGIVSHVNYRSSGKWDIGPAFNWDRVIRGVQAK